jgi:hypothetical protein
LPGVKSGELIPSAAQSSPYQQYGLIKHVEIFMHKRVHNKKKQCIKMANFVKAGRRARLMYGKVGADML